MTTTKNSELFSLNVPPIVECIRTMNAILVFPTILQSSRLWDGGKQIMHCFRIWPRWQGLYPRPDVLSNVCSVFLDELQIATWQRSRLRDSTISDLMMYKAAFNLRKFVFPELEEEEDYPVSEVVGNIPAEWEQDWWKRKLRREVRSEIMDRFIEDDE